MITDALLQFDAANATIRAAGTYVSTNTIDLSVNRDIGRGEDLYILFNVDVTFAGGTSVQPQVITSASSNLSSPTILGTAAAQLEAALVAGYMWSIRLPARPVPSGTPQRYLGVQYIGVGTHTAGSISARIVKNVDLTDYYPSGFTVA